MHVEGHDALLVLRGRERHTAEVFSHIRKTAAHEALEAEDRVTRIRNGVDARLRANAWLLALFEVDRRGNRSRVSGRLQDFGTTIVVARHQGVGGAKVDADDGCRLIVEDSEF